MESDLAFIQVQLWVVIALLAFFIASNILCRIFSCGQPKDENFGDLWDRGKVDDLLKRTERRLRERPHDIGALYYGARALMAEKRFVEARGHLERLSAIEPSLQRECSEQLDVIERALVGT